MCIYVYIYIYIHTLVALFGGAWAADAPQERARQAAAGARELA